MIFGKNSTLFTTIFICGNFYCIFKKELLVVFPIPYGRIGGTSSYQGKNYWKLFLSNLKGRIIAIFLETWGRI